LAGCVMESLALGAAPPAAPFMVPAGGGREGWGCRQGEVAAQAGEKATLLSWQVSWASLLSLRALHTRNLHHAAFYTAPPCSATVPTAGLGCPLH